MIEQNPNITVLMPAYNAADYITDAIQSILMQTYADFEFIIINDGSSDNTSNIIAQFNDKRLIIINQENSGISKALNKGLQIAKGKYIARFDADDICYPERLQKQISFLESNPDYVVIGSDAEYISASGNHLCFFESKGHSNAAIMKDLYKYCPFTHSSVMYKKDAVEQCGGYNINAHTFEDYLLWIQLSHHGKFANLNEPLIKVRFSAASITIDETWRGQRFRRLKQMIINEGAITFTQGEEIRSIINHQNTVRIKTGAYHALCSKKFLVNNHQPSKARTHIRKAILIHPLRLDNYLLLLLSFAPEKLVQWVYQNKMKMLKTIS